MLSKQISTATFTDLYQLSMIQSYWREEMFGEAVFDLFVRRSKNRDYFIACGIQEALKEVENLSFKEEELEYIRNLDQFSDEFVENYLEDFEFTGDVYSVEEGEIFYPNEPIVQVVGPLPEAQLIETFLLNQIQHQSGVCSKASRIVNEVDAEIVADFGMRRGPGAEAALKGSRAMYIAGVDATSNVSAGMEYGIPVTGTMAHSYVEAHESEKEAFREFATTYPETIVLIDTYDTIRGVKKVVNLMDETNLHIRGVRLDSGNLVELSKKCRNILDENGYPGVLIFASNGLDEHKIHQLRSEGALIDGYGVGTKMMTVSDQPYLDAVYKLCEYKGKGRMKLSSGKSNVPGKKQVYRYSNDKKLKDLVVSRNDETDYQTKTVEPLLNHVIKNGEIIRNGNGESPFFYTLEELRERVSNKPKVSRNVELSELLKLKRDSTAERVEKRARKEVVS